jgi:hypothetical protein
MIMCIGMMVSMSLVRRIYTHEEALFLSVLTSFVSLDTKGDQMSM